MQNLTAARVQGVQSNTTIQIAGPPCRQIHFVITNENASVNGPGRFYLTHYTNLAVLRCGPESPCESAVFGGQTINAAVRTPEDAESLIECRGRVHATICNESPQTAAVFRINRVDHVLIRLDHDNSSSCGHGRSKSAFGILAQHGTALGFLICPGERRSTYRRLPDSVQPDGQSRVDGAASKDIVAVSGPFGRIFFRRFSNRDFVVSGATLQPRFLPARCCFGLRGVPFGTEGVQSGQQNALIAETLRRRRVKQTVGREHAETAGAAGPVGAHVVFSFEVKELDSPFVQKQITLSSLRRIAANVMTRGDQPSRRDRLLHLARNWVISFSYLLAMLPHK